jgi:hypothetical protein
MNKYLDLKNEPQYHSGSLRGRIEEAVKRLHDETEEIQQDHGKRMPVIPVTGAGNAHKYLENKSRETF